MGGSSDDAARCRRVDSVAEGKLLPPFSWRRESVLLKARTADDLMAARMCW